MFKKCLSEKDSQWLDLKTKDIRLQRLYTSHYFRCQLSTSTDPDWNRLIPTKVIQLFDVQYNLLHKQPMDFFSLQLESDSLYAYLPVKLILDSCAFKCADFPSLHSVLKEFMFLLCVSLRVCLLSAAGLSHMGGDFQQLNFSSFCFHMQRQPQRTASLHLSPSLFPFPHFFSTPHHFMSFDSFPFLTSSPHILSFFYSLALFIDPNLSSLFSASIFLCSLPLVSLHLHPSCHFTVYTSFLIRPSDILLIHFLF